MKISSCFTLALIILVLGLTIDARIAAAQVTAFTYQGQLKSGGNAASGTYDLQFALYLTNVDGTVYAGPVTNYAVGVTNGLFSTTVDFGAGIYRGVSNWLQIGVSTNGANSFTTLSPRQELTPVPSAVFASTASNLLGSLPASQLSGPISSNQLGGTYNGVVSFNNLGNNFSGNGFGLTNTVTTGNYAFLYAYLPQSSPTSNTIRSVSFQDPSGFFPTILLKGWSYSLATLALTCNQTGLYLVQYTAGAGTLGSPTTVSMWVAQNGQEIEGSQAAVYVNNPSQPMLISKSLLMSANATDTLQIKYYCDTAQGQLTGSGFGLRKPSCSITIVRIQ